MLQGVKTEIGEVCGFGMAEDAKDTTLVVEMIVGEGEFLTHFEVSVRSSEWAQASRSAAMELSITARPLCSMRNEPSRVTWPSSRAATLYCLAVWRTAASFDGVTETMARAPRSLKSAASAGGGSSVKLMVAPRAGRASPAPTEEDAGAEAKQDSARVTARPPSEMSWADWTVPSAARAMRQSMRRFSAARSMAGGSPATTLAIVFEYSEEENSRWVPSRGAACCAPTVEAEPLRMMMMSPSLRKAIFTTCEASSRIPRTPITGVG